MIFTPEEEKWLKANSEKIERMSVLEIKNYYDQFLPSYAFRDQLAILVAYLRGEDFYIKKVSGEYCLCTKEARLISLRLDVFGLSRIKEDLREKLIDYGIPENIRWKIIDNVKIKR